MAGAIIEVAPDELRRAYTVALLSSQHAGDRRDNDEEVSSIFAGLVRQFSSEKATALLSRVLALMVWVEAGDSDGLVWNGGPPLHLPEVHPAVLDVIATIRLPPYGLPKSAVLHSAIQKRLRSYGLLAS